MLSQAYVFSKWPEMDKIYEDITFVTKNSMLCAEWKNVCFTGNVYIFFSYLKKYFIDFRKFLLILHYEEKWNYLINLPIEIYFVYLLNFDIVLNFFYPKTYFEKSFSTLFLAIFSFLILVTIKIPPRSSELNYFLLFTGKIF
jgi:hypothetical protein